MSGAGARAFGSLALEALRDAARRRLVVAVAGAALLTLLLFEGCTRCGTAEVVLQGQGLPAEALAAWASAVGIGALGLWTVALGALLGAEAVAGPVDSGAAALVLARPVGRTSFALARVAGALGVVLATGALLMAGAGALLVARAGLPAAPVPAALGAASLGAAFAAALAAWLALHLPRAAAALLAAVGCVAVAFANALVLAGAREGATAALGTHGPPLGTALAHALAAWLEPAELPGSLAGAWARLALWAAGACALLALDFHRRDLSE